MKKDSLISIVVPTYNRSGLIAETIESIVAQSYENWECLIIDDGSKDNTREVVAKFSDQDPRIKFYERTNDYSPGGNGARNYGLYLAKGDYIVFFDSDDLMTPDHLEVKYGLIEDGRYDFGVTRTKFFNYSNDKIDRYYNFSTKDISKKNYILQKVNWLTLDVIIKSNIAKSIMFDETLKSGQEYNYFSKLVCETDKGIFANHVVSLRRKHDNSKRSKLQSPSKKYKSVAISCWKTFLYIEPKVNFETRKRLLFRVYKSIIRSKKRPNEIGFSLFWSKMTQSFKAGVLIKFIYYHINKHTSRLNSLRKIALNPN